MMAFLKGSRYLALDRFEEGSAFSGVKPRPIKTATPVLEHTIALKDRLDALAHNYYTDPRLWVRLAEANREAIFPEDLLFEPAPLEENGREKLGEIILVPRRQEDSS